MSKRVGTVGLSAAIAAMSSAYAADMPVKASPPAPVAASSWDFTVNQDVRYFSWSSTPRGFPTSLAPGGHGTEVYAPLAFQAVGRPADDLKLEVLTRGGYVSAHQSVGGSSGQGGEIPEPGSLAALGTALVALVGFTALRRRRWI